MVGVVVAGVGVVVVVVAGVFAGAGVVGERATSDERRALARMAGVKHG